MYGGEIHLSFRLKALFCTTICSNVVLLRCTDSCRFPRGTTEENFLFYVIVNPKRGNIIWKNFLFGIVFTYAFCTIIVAVTKKVGTIKLVKRLSCQFLTDPHTVHAWTRRISEDIHWSVIRAKHHGLDHKRTSVYQP